MSGHAHDWHELGRVFPFDGMTAEGQSPHGLHDPKTGELVEPGKMTGKVKALFEEKVPTSVAPHIILQCQDEACPDGPKHIEHVDLTSPEWSKLASAYEKGLLDPDGNGTNRYVSQLSLTDLGLDRIQQMLGQGRRSGASESPVAL